MHPVEVILLENIDFDNVLFVFPTDVAASRWADHLLRLRRGGSLAMDKFIAWDKFKQNSVRSKVQNKISIPSVLRKIFINALLRENAGTAVFNSLIPREWAQNSNSYADWLTDILPQLGIWFNLALDLPISGILEAQGKLDELIGDDRDLFYLALLYTQFLEKHSLFEPAWETPPFDDTVKKCFIFFSESLSDFNEYKGLLEAGTNVKIVETGNGDKKNAEVFFYTNSRSEITEAALYILALHENQNIPWDSIQVSIPDGEYYSPYLLRELENRNIPYVKQSGKDLASYPGGKLFPAILDCFTSDFSFSSLKALVLNQHLPWKDTGKIQDLIEFGIKNNCICSWTEINGEKVNVWEDAFNNPFGSLKPETKKFFYDLKHRVNALCTASSFSEIRKQYFAFRESFFDMGNCLHETDIVLSRCISELMYLVDIERSFPEVKIIEPFSFFSGYLGEINYLAQQTSGGIIILPYRTAAPAPFDCHIILGANHENLSLVYSPLTFISSLKRKELGISDNDASLSFIHLHQLNSRLPAAFFCSEQTFSGYNIPHSSLDAPLVPRQRYRDDPLFENKFADDLYDKESKSIASLYHSGSNELPFPKEFHFNQLQGYHEWLLRRGCSSLQPGVNNSDIENNHDLLLDLIKKRFCKDAFYKGKYSVSSSSLGPYFQCRLKWLFERVLGSENIEIDTGLMASDISGQVFHAVLSLFLEHIKIKNEIIKMPLSINNNGNIKLELPDIYNKILEEKINFVFKGFPRLPGSDRIVMSALTARLLRAEKEMYHLRLKKFLIAFISFFAGHRVLACEDYYNLEKDFYYLNGRVDCVLEKTDDEISNDIPNDISILKDSIVIVDFKTKNMPPLADCTGREDGLDGSRGLSDFQLPMYLRLIEGVLKKEVHTALFFSIIDAVPQVVFGVIKNSLDGYKIPFKEENYVLRGTDNFNNIMKEFDEKARQFAFEISNAVFSFSPPKNELCFKCEHNKVCRSLYKINQGFHNGI